MTPTAGAEGLARLNEQRSRAATRVNDLEGEWRTANQQASAALTEIERH
jgi:hypothetical protein